LLVIILVAALITINFKSNNNLRKEYKEANKTMLKTKEELKNIDKKFSDLENNLKMQIDETLKKENERNESKFNSIYAKIAEIYYAFTRDELFAIKQGEKEEYENEHWFRHFMCLASFYSILTEMSEFSSNELHFIRFVKKFPDEYNKNVPMPDIKFFYHLLLFIEYSEKIDAVIFEETKITYNKLLKTLDYDKVIEHIKTIGFGKERTENLLKLAEYYRDKGYLEKYNFDKL